MRAGSRLPSLVVGDVPLCRPARFTALKVTPGQIRLHHRGVRLVRKAGGRRWVHRVITEIQAMVEHSDGVNATQAGVACNGEEGEPNWRGVTR